MHILAMILVLQRNPPLTRSEITLWNCHNKHLFFAVYYLVCIALKPLVLLFGRLVGGSAENVVTDRRNGRPSTITLAAHARRR